MSLLRQIQEAAIDSSVDLPTLLRKCTVLAARLGSSEFKQWINHELSGYPGIEDLPDYRILNVHSKGHFSGPFGSGLRNADIPLSCIPQQLREKLAHSYLRQPVAAMESLVANRESSLLQEPWNPDLVAHVGQNIYEGMNCMQAWKVISPAAIVAALDAVRTRVLNFVLEIEAQDPAAGEARLNSNPLPQEKVQQIFNTYITGNVQNLATGSTDVRQNAKYLEGANAEFFSRLLDTIAKAGLRPEATAPLISAVEEMREARGTGTFRKHYQSFVSILADHMQVLGPVVAPFLPALSAMVP